MPMVLPMHTLTGQDELDCTAGPGPTTRLVALHCWQAEMWQGRGLDLGLERSV